MLKRLNQEGFEIGLHSSYRAFESPEGFLAEKRTLEEASGGAVHGNRHHYWRLNPDDCESTLLIHELVGFSYDTSLGYERYLGWRRGLSWPFFPFYQKQRRELRTVQISTAWMDDHLFGHRANNPGDRFSLLKSLADVAREQGGCLLVDIHDYVYDPVLFPEWAQTYRKLLEYLLSRSDFWIELPVRIAEHWKGRYDRIVQGSQGLTAGHG